MFSESPFSTTPISSRYTLPPTSVFVTGVEVSLFSGTPTVTGAAVVQAVGSAITLQLGEVAGKGSSSVTVNGMQVNLSLGDMLVWGQVPDYAFANWAPVDDSQTAGWGDVSDEQYPMWSNIPN